MRLPLRSKNAIGILEIIITGIRRGLQGNEKQGSIVGIKGCENLL